MTSEQKDILESLIDGVLILYRETIIFGNKTACEMLGYDEIELLQTPLKTIFPSNYYYNTFLRVCSQDSVKYIESEVLTKKGEIFSANFSISTYNPNNEPLYSPEDSLKLVLIRNIADIELARQVGIRQFQAFAKNLFSVALIRFESGSRGPVIVMFDKFPFKVKSNFDEKTLLMKMAIFYLTAVAGGTSYSCGLYGPLPVTGRDDYLSMVFTNFLKNPEAKDKRSEAKEYIMTIVTFPKYIESLFVNRKKLKEDFINFFGNIKIYSDLKSDFIPNIKELLVISKKTTDKDTQRALERKLAAITELSNDIVNILDLEAAMDFFADFAEKVLNFKYFSILLLNKNRNTLKVISTRNYDPDIVKNLEIDVADTKSAIARCANQGEIINIPDVTKINYYMEVKDDIQSELDIPIKLGYSSSDSANMEIIGVIHLGATNINAFDSNDVRMMIALAAQIANFLARRDYDRKLREIYDLNFDLSNVQNANEVYGIIIDFVSKVLNWSIFTIYTISRRLKHIRRVSSLGMDFSEKIENDSSIISLHDHNNQLIDLVTKGKEIVLDCITDKDIVEGTKIESFCALPVISQDKIIGILETRKSGEIQFNPDDVNLLKSLSRIISMHINQKRMEIFQMAVFQMAEKLVTITNAFSVLEEVVGIVSRSLDYEFFSISLVNHERETVNLVAFYGFTPNLNSIKSINIMSIESIVVRAARERRMISINRKSKEIGKEKTDEDRTIESELAVPFFSSDGNILGVLNVESEFINSFNYYDIIILDRLGKILSKAVERFPMKETLFFPFKG